MDKDLSIKGFNLSSKSRIFVPNFLPPLSPSKNDFKFIQGNSNKPKNINKSSQIKKVIKTKNLQSNQEEAYNIIFDINEVIESPMLLKKEIKFSTKLLLFMEEYANNPLDSKMQKELLLFRPLYIAAGCPYDGLLRFCPMLFALHLKRHGVSDKDLFIDVPHIIFDAITTDANLPWNLFISKLSICTYDFPSRDIGLLKISNIGRFLDASKLGFTDYRLKHAIVTMQRVIRHSKSKPVPSEYIARKKWLIEVENLRIPDQVQSEKYCINIWNLNQIQNIVLTNCVEDIYISILYWNRHLIYTSIMKYILGRNCILNNSDFLIYHLNDYLGTNLNILKKTHNHNLTLRLKNKDNDYYSKIHEVIHLDMIGALDEFRHPLRDSLKFTHMHYKEYDTSDGYLGITEFYQRKMSKMDILTVDRILLWTEKLRSINGKRLLHEFSSTVKDVNKLTIDLLKYWFFEIVVIPLDELSPQKYNKDLNVKMVSRFLMHIVAEDTISNYSAIVGFLRKVLTEHLNNLRKVGYCHKIRHPVHLHPPQMNLVMIKK